jgi:hypothetical protein
MSISINKLMNLGVGSLSVDYSKNNQRKEQFGSKELPDKLETRKSEGVQDLSASQYYASVKGNRMPKNVGNILQLGTPSGANAQRGNKTVQVPIFSEPDGAIDPNRIRSITDPNSAQPYTFEGAYGLEGGVKFSIPKSTKTSNNSIGLLRQAQMSYQNRQQILAPRQPQTQADNGILQEVGTSSPPPYQDTDSTPYKDDNQDSELNESYN